MALYKADKDGIVMCSECNGHGVVCVVCENSFSISKLVEKCFSEKHSNCGWFSDENKTQLETHSYYQQHFKNDSYSEDGTKHCENCEGDGYHYPDDYDND